MRRLSLADVCDDMISLKKQGIYEVELVKAFSEVRTNFSGWSLLALEKMFAYGDPQRIRDAGDPMPEGEKFTLYRGVAGKRPRRKVAGLSWTRSLETAFRFAGRNRHQGNPAVYKTTVAAVDVWCYISQRNEDEFVLKAKRYRRLSVQEITKALGLNCTSEPRTEVDNCDEVLKVYPIK